MQVREQVPLSELTTLRVGGPARRLVTAATVEEVIEVVAGADAAGEALLIIAGGSNLLIGDQGFDGTVVQMALGGIAIGETGDGVRLVAGAGEPWDRVVAACVDAGLAGVECLSGIPGSTGATPIQNVGAYGQDVSETVVSVSAYDRRSQTVVELEPGQCGFGYRTSAFKGSDRYVVLRVAFALDRSPLARGIRYAELARALGVEPGGRPSLGATREAVLELRRGKGMVIDPDDPDSVSAGSFFLNPILSREAFTSVQRRAAQRLGEGTQVPVWPDADGSVKTSAAWLIEHAGFHRGYGNGRAGISSKHTLAIVNRGGASSEELVAVAREMRDGVQDAFGVELHPEPTLVGIEL
ncbi:MAG: UDP-N-acetylmuramate dehydrogenase [Solirubrobacteraceae bacterium]